MYKGFVTIKKGGDAAIYRVGQAVAAGWTSPTIFQNSVGAKTGDASGVPTAGDPAAPGVGVLALLDLFTISELARLVA